MISTKLIPVFVVVLMMAQAAPKIPLFQRRFGMMIRPIDETSTSSLPQVFGLKPCDGPGRVVTARIEGCSNSSTCQIPAETLRDSELDFIPSENLPELGVRINVIFPDGEITPVLEEPLRDSAVQGGRLYRMYLAGLINEEFRGTTLTMQYTLFRIDTNNAEVCTQADFDIV